MDWREELRLAREATERAIRQRTAELARSASDLEARGRKIYGDAIRTGREVVARTPAELRQLAMAAQAAPEAVKRSVEKIAEPARRFVAEAQTPTGRARLIENVKQQGRAAISGAVDEASFGLADKGLSAADAIWSGGLEDLGERYSANQRERQAADAYDEQHYGTSRGIGRIAGFAADLAVGGAPGLARGAASLVPRGARLYDALTTSHYLLDPRGLNVMAAAGGGLGGIIGQAVDDAGHMRLSSGRDYLAAGIGGAAGGLETLRGNPVSGGAVEGAVSAAARDVLDGRSVDTRDVLDGAKRGALGGGIGGVGGALFGYVLPRRETGKLGELLSSVKMFARGDGVPTRTGKRFYLDNGKYTYPDLEFQTSRPGKRIGIGEAKLGPNAQLTDRQLEAMAQPDIDYVVDGWRYSDIGKMAGAAFAPTADRILQYDAETGRLR